MNKRRELEGGSGRTVLVDGSTVGPYTLSYLASGGMSSVYKGERDGTTYVLKEVATANTKEVPYLISERGLLERLDHPGVVGFEGFFNEGGYYYLVLEYIPGRPLSDYINSARKADPIKVGDWGLQLCEIFDYLHSQKPPVIYRDLKSENILLHDGNVTLIDFGIARLHKGERQKDTELMGSPATASPEHYGGAETDARSDIYTLGATLYEILTGGQRKSTGAFQFAPVRELNPDVSPELEAVLTKATQFKAEERFQSAREMREALAKALGREPSLPRDTQEVDSTRLTQAHLSAPLPSASSEDKGPEKSSSFPLLPLVIVALLVAGAGYLYQQKKAAESPFYGGPVPSIGSYEENLEADIFSTGEVDGLSTVTLGDDIGLFRVSPWREEDEATRAKTLANRLNSLYHKACISCGGTGLEPKDIKVGKHDETQEVVVFYAHMHGSRVIGRTELLATVNKTQAEQLEVTPRFVATYWRDLLRDTVNISRGREVPESVLGPELSSALLKARSKLKRDAEQITRLRAVLSELTGKESLRLQDLFLRVPERKLPADGFNSIKGYSQLTL